MNRQTTMLPQATLAKAAAKTKALAKAVANASAKANCLAKAQAVAQQANRIYNQWLLVNAPTSTQTTTLSTGTFNAGTVYVTGGTAGPAGSMGSNTVINSNPTDAQWTWSVTDGTEMRRLTAEELFYELGNRADVVAEWIRRNDFDYVCPDNTVLRFKGGDVTIDDSNAQTIYKSAPIREFNKYLNASDLLEEFVRFCGEHAITRNEFNQLPVSLFIMWLIVRVAETDQEDPGEALPALTSGMRERRIHRHRCRGCGRFLSRRHAQHGVAFCRPDHMQRYVERVSL